MSFLQDRWKLLLQFCQPIPNDVMPGLMKHQRKAALRLPLLIIISFPLTTLLEITVGTTSTHRMLTFFVIFETLWMLLLWLLSRTSWLKHHPQRAAFGVGLFCAFFLSSSTMVQKDPLMIEVILVLLVFSPFLLASINFWQPTYTLFIGILCLAMTQIAEFLLLQNTSKLTTIRLSTGISLSFFGMVVNQVVRRIWFDLEQTRRQLFASDRLEKLGQMTAGIAHELKTPIAAIDSSITTSQGLLDELKESIGHQEVTEDDLQEITKELQESLNLSNRAIKRAASFVGAIRNHTRALSTAGRIHFCISERFETILALLNHRCKKNEFQVHTALQDASITLFGDPSKFDQILTNMLENAFDAMEESSTGRQVWLSVQQKSEAIIRIDLEDQGPGISEELSERIFDYLFTTKLAHKGTGLGLALCRDIVESEFSGKIQLEAPTEPGRGAHFVLLLYHASLPNKERNIYTPGNLNQEEPHTQ